MTPHVILNLFDYFFKNLWFFWKMSGFPQDLINVVTLGCLLNIVFLDCFVALLLAMTSGGIVSGERARSAIVSLERIWAESSNNILALSVSEMQGTFACFLFLPSFAVESSARNVQNGFTLSFGRERFIFSAWLFAYYEFQSIALRQRSSLYAHNPLCLANKEKEVNKLNITYDIRLPITWVMYKYKAYAL